MARYIPSNTFTPVEERVLNTIKYYSRSLDFMMIKSSPKRCIIPSSLNNCIEVLLLMLLIAQIMIKLRSEPMKIKRQFQRDI